ncbi:hypothetical protein [Streptomyces sp. Wb2n-11]|uniref:hypothetical protein n=1 Tax=Streptomyces sp. Wb2n-11 TaxID=1030533 RepID=UPI000B109DDB|nr:hypothetical protein [Streptomyces sp. Wb2n-11]
MRSPHFRPARPGAARRHWDDGRRRLSRGSGLGRAVSITAVAAVVLSAALAGYAPDTGVRDAGVAEYLPQSAQMSPPRPEGTLPRSSPAPAPRKCPHYADVLVLPNGAATAGPDLRPALLHPFSDGVPSPTGTARTLP